MREGQWMGRGEKDMGREERVRQGKEGEGKEEDFLAFPQFQICHYTTAWHYLFCAAKASTIFIQGGHAWAVMLS